MVRIEKAESFLTPKLRNDIQRRLWNIREMTKQHVANGDYQGYIDAHRDYMREFVSHPKDALELPPTPRTTAPLFSRKGLNMIKILFKEFFRKRTPEDIELAKKMQEIVRHRYNYC